MFRSKSVTLENPSFPNNKFLFALGLRFSCFPAVLPHPVSWLSPEVSLGLAPVSPPPGCPP